LKVFVKVSTKRKETILDNLKNGGMGNLKQHAMKQKLWGKVFPFEFDYERHDAEV